MPPEDVRITKPAEGSIPVVAGIAPVVAAPVAAAPVVPAAEVAAPVVPAAAPVVAAPVETPPVALAATEELPTAQPTLFEAAEARAAEKAKGPAVEEKPAAEGEKPKAEEKPATEAKADPEKPAADPAKPAEAPKVEAAPAAPVAPKEVKFEYVLPEGITLPEKETGELHTALTTYATNPADKAAQQSLVDFHFARLADSIRDYNRLAHKTFADKRTEWQRQVMDHPEIGGGNHDAAMQAIAYVRDNFLSSHPRGSKQYEAVKKGLDEWMHLTGAGDNPYFLELMHNISVRLNEPQMQATQEIRPIVQLENGGRPAIYKHPTSFPRR